MRKLVTIRHIAGIKPIEGADRVELAQIDGWRCVVRKNDFVVGEQIVFFEPDTAFTNVDDDRISFLKKTSHKQWKKADGTLVAECLRIKTIRLAGQISQGLVMKISRFEKEIATSEKDGLSLEEVIGIRHYDSLSEEMDVKLGKFSASVSRGHFPHFVPKTDLPRIQNYLGLFETCKNMQFEVTEKMDGSSMSVGYSQSHLDTEPYFVASRNQMLQTGGRDNYNRLAMMNNLQTILKEHHDETGDELCVQGELVGPRINGNKDNLIDFDYRIFQIWNITHCKWLTVGERMKFCEKHQLNHVRVIDDRQQTFKSFQTIDELVEYVRAFKTANNNPVEGLVFKSQDGDTTFKVLNPDYLLKND